MTVYAQPGPKRSTTPILWVVAVGALLGLLAVAVVVVATRADEPLAYGQVDDPVALVPGDAWLDDGTLASVRDEALADDLTPTMVVRPTGDPDLARAVFITLRPIDTRYAGGEHVTVGQLSGTYTTGGGDDDAASVAVGDGQRTVELTAAPGTPSDTLTELAAMVDLHAPVGAQQLSGGWEVVTDSDRGRDGHLREFEAVSSDGRAGLSIRSWSGVDESLVSLIPSPFLTVPVEVRGRPGLALGDHYRAGAAVGWVEAPGVVVWMYYRDGGSGSIDDAVAMAEQLVQVDAEGWDAFVTERAPSPDQWGSGDITEAVGEAGPLPAGDDAEDEWWLDRSRQFSGVLADGREFLVVDHPDSGPCAIVDWESPEECPPWDEPAVGIPRLLPDPTWSADAAQPVLVYGAVPDGAVMVVMRASDGRHDDAAPWGSVWGIALRPGAVPESVRFVGAGGLTLYELVHDPAVGWRRMD